MTCTLPSDADGRPITLDGAGTLGQRIAGVYAAGGTDVRIFDLSEEQRDVARDYVAQHVDDIKQTLGLDPARTCEVELADDLGTAVRGLGW